MRFPEVLVTAIGVHVLEVGWLLVWQVGFDRHDSFNKVEILSGSHVLVSVIFGVVDDTRVGREKARTMHFK